MSSRQSAVVLAFDPAGRVLVLRRGPTAPWKPRHWNFPGGMVDTGEAVQAAAYRELAEETGIRLASGLSWAFSFRANGFLTHVFWVRLPARPNVRFPDGEHDKYRWVALPQIPQPVIPGLRYIVQQVTGSSWNLAPLGDVAQHLSPDGGTSGQHGGHSRRRPSMSQSWPNKYTNWPKYLPYPQPIRRGWIPVPNVQSVNWPQSQFAPLYLAPGSPSYQPYSYLRQDVPYDKIQPKLTAVIPPALVPQHPSSPAGPGGDIAQLPAYGDLMYATANPSLQPIPHSYLKHLGIMARMKVRGLEGKIKRLLRKKRKTITEQNRLQQLMAQHTRVRVKLMSYKPSSNQDFSGYGDGFAYELAPLQAASHNLRDYGLGTYGGIGGLGDCGCGGSSYAGDCGCGGAKHNPALGSAFLEKTGIKDEAGEMTTFGWAVIGATVVAGVWTASKYA